MNQLIYIIFLKDADSWDHNVFVFQGLILQFIFEYSLDGSKSISLISKNYLEGQLNYNVQDVQM